MGSDYWRNNHTLEHLTPIGERFPEIGLAPSLRMACGSGTVVEFGCGDGRIAEFFDPQKYFGWDINPAAIDAARQGQPRHTFGYQPREADIALAYTVLLHVPDDQLPAVVDQMQRYGKKIIVGEIMGRKWRNEDGIPPCYNRELSEYEALLGHVSEVISIPYPRYRTDLRLCVWR